MSSKDILRVLEGEAVWPPPIWLMRQAGRYLPEYRKLRTQVGGFMEAVLNPNIATEISLQPWKRYNFDAIILFSDILVIPYGLGQKVSFAGGEGPRLEPIDSPDKLSQLSTSRLTEQLAPIIQTVKNIHSQLDNHTTLIGFAGAPWTVACYMLDGQGGNFPQTTKLSKQEPHFVSSLIDLLVESTIEYLSWQISNGAEVIQIFESWAAILDHNDFHTFSTKPILHICKALKQKFPQVKIIVYARGSSLNVLSYVSAYIDGLSLDQSYNIKKLRELLPSSTLALQGNLNPLILELGGDPLRRDFSSLVSNIKHTPHIIGVGSGLSKYTQPQHVHTLVELTRELAK